MKTFTHLLITFSLLWMLAACSSGGDGGGNSNGDAGDDDVVIDEVILLTMSLGDGVSTLVVADLGNDTVELDSSGVVSADTDSLVSQGDSDETIIGLNNEIRVEGSKIYIDDVMALDATTEYLASLTEVTTVERITIDPFDFNVIVIDYVPPVGPSTAHKGETYVDADSSLEWTLSVALPLTPDTGDIVYSSYDERSDNCAALDVDSTLR